MKNINLLLVVIIAATLLSFSFVRQAGKSKWTAPADASALINPTKGNASMLAEGKKIYDSNCAICHGLKGKGDGIAAAGLNKPPADHTSSAIQAVSDGGLYWMISEGNTPMPSYKKTYSETQRWELVDYIRTLAKPQKK